MSSASSRSRPGKRVQSMHGGERRSRNTSRVRSNIVSYNDAYTYALRAAYLHHLLQPRAKRKQYIAAPKPVRKTAMIGDLVQDFSLIKDTKSQKFPHGFMSPLEKRIQGVLVGKEKRI
jgi:hypothetical protein